MGAHFGYTLENLRLPEAIAVANANFAFGSVREKGQRDGKHSMRRLRALNSIALFQPPRRLGWGWGG